MQFSLHFVRENDDCAPVKIYQEIRLKCEETISLFYFYLGKPHKLLFISVFLLMRPWMKSIFFRPHFIYVKISESVGCPSWFSLQPLPPGPTPSTLNYHKSFQPSPAHPQQQIHRGMRWPVEAHPRIFILYF